MPCTALASEDTAQVVDAIQRYFYYIELDVSHKHIAAFREEWAGNALALVPPLPPSHVTMDFYNDLVRGGEGRSCGHVVWGEGGVHVLGHM